MASGANLRLPIGLRYVVTYLKLTNCLGNLFCLRQQLMQWFSNVKFSKHLCQFVGTVPFLAHVKTNQHKHHLPDVGRCWETAAYPTIIDSLSSRESNSCSRVVVTALKEVQRREPRWQPSLYFPIKQKAVSVSAVSEYLSSQNLSNALNSYEGPRGEESLGDEHLASSGIFLLQGSTQSTARRFFRLGFSTWPPEPSHRVSPLLDSIGRILAYVEMGTEIVSTWQCSCISLVPPWANEWGF